MSNNSQYVAVDVSKAALDIAMPGANQVWRSTDTVAGIAALERRLATLEHPHVVCEATGRYGRLLARQMGTAGIATSIVNPRQVRDFARATGQLAKTDALDAGIILRFADAMQPARTPPTPENQARLAEQVRRRPNFQNSVSLTKSRSQPLLASRP